MTMPDERARALVWAGGFLVELARDKTLPIEIRKRAVVIARHFPTLEDVGMMALSGASSGLELPDNHHSWEEQCKLGPLRYVTTLGWPEE